MSAMQFELAKAHAANTLPVDMLAQTLAAMGSRVASRLEPLPAMIKMLAPEISAERLAKIERRSPRRATSPPREPGSCCARMTRKRRP
jgi:hypothetical protein